MSWIKRKLVLVFFLLFQISPSLLADDALLFEPGRLKIHSRTDLFYSTYDFEYVSYSYDGQVVFHVQASCNATVQGHIENAKDSGKILRLAVGSLLDRSVIRTEDVNRVLSLVDGTPLLQTPWLIHPDYLELPEPASCGMCCGEPEHQIKIGNASYSIRFREYQTWQTLLFAARQNNFCIQINRAEFAQHPSPSFVKLIPMPEDRSCQAPPLVIMGKPI